MGVTSMEILNIQALNVDNLATKLLNEQTHLKGDIKYGY